MAILKTYTISTDTSNGQVHSDRIHKEILDSGYITNFDGVSIIGDFISIMGDSFINESGLDNLLSLHNGSQEIISNYNIITTNEMHSIELPEIAKMYFNSDIESGVYWSGNYWVSLGGVILPTPSFIEDFESGSFSTNNWVTIQGGENNWYIGNGTIISGTKSAYISANSGVTASYTSIGSTLDVSHLYIDLLLPIASEYIKLCFDWICEAEVGYDYFRVFNTTTSINPVANVELNTTYRIGKTEYNNQSILATEEISIPIEQANTIRRICFSWRNDYSIENVPPAVLDNIKILYK